MGSLLDVAPPGSKINVDHLMKANLAVAYKDL